MGLQTANSCIKFLYKIVSIMVISSLHFNGKTEP